MHQADRALDPFEAAAVGVDRDGGIAQGTLERLGLPRAGVAAVERTRGAVGRHGAGV